MVPAKPFTKTEVRIALGITTALLLELVLVNAFFYSPRGADFSATYTGGLILRREGASKLYDLSEQGRVEKELFGRKNILPCDHPPFEILFFAPLTKLSYRMAYVLWGVFSVLLLVFFQYLFRPFAPVPRRPEHYFLLCFLFFPVWASLMQGQMSILLLVVFTLTFIQLEHRQDYRAGFLLGLGLFKFPIVLPFALICFLRSKWKLMAGFATAALLLAGLSLIAVGPGGILAYLNMLFAALRNPNPTFSTTIQVRDMPTLRGFITTLMAPWASSMWIEIAAAFVGTVMILVTAWLWRRQDRLGSRSESGVMFAAALVTALVTSPYVLTHDLTLMLIPVLLVLGSSGWASKSSLTRILTVCIGILYVPPVYVLLLRNHIQSLLFPVLLFFALGTLYLAARPFRRLTDPTSAQSKPAATGL